MHGQRRRGGGSSTVDVSEDSAIELPVVSAGGGETEGCVRCAADIGPGRTGIGADLPLNRWCGNPRCRGGEGGGRACRDRGVGRVGRDNRARFRQRDAGRCVIDDQGFAVEGFRRTIGQPREGPGQIRRVDDREDVSSGGGVATRKAQRLARDRQVTDHLELAVACSERGAIDRRADDGQGRNVKRLTGTHCQVRR